MGSWYQISTGVATGIQGLNSDLKQDKDFRVGKTKKNKGHREEAKCT